MQLTATYNSSSIKEIKSSFVVNKVKEIVHRYDKCADIVLFGSRARGDWNEESDWDFLILSDLDEQSEVKEKIRKDILSEIEYKTLELVFALFHNKKIWEEDYSVTNIYESISEDGICV